VETFYSDEIFTVVLVFVWVSEDNLGERCTTAWIMNDFFYDTLNVARTR
jgi:hypothetical protein